MILIAFMSTAAKCLKVHSSNLFYAGLRSDKTDSYIIKQNKHVLDNFPFTTFLSTPNLGPTKPPIKWIPEALSLGIKRPVREADHSPPSTVEVKNAWSYTSTPPTSSWRGA